MAPTQVDALLLLGSRDWIAALLLPAAWIVIPPLSNIALAGHVAVPLDVVQFTPAMASASGTLAGIWMVPASAAPWTERG